MNMYKQFKEKRLPEQIQKEVEAFAKENAKGKKKKFLFAAGFYIGMHINKIRKATGVDECPKPTRNSECSSLPRAEAYAKYAAGH